MTHSPESKCRCAINADGGGAREVEVGRKLLRPGVWDVCPGGREVPVDVKQLLGIPGQALTV